MRSVVGVRRSLGKFHGQKSSSFLCSKERQKCSESQTSMKYQIHGRLLMELLLIMDRLERNEVKGSRVGIDVMCDVV